MRIIIVGAGLGGLSAAVCFTKHGHQVLLLERREKPTAQGGAINIRPGATRILHSWGLRPRLEAVSTDTPTTILRSMETGHITTRNVASDASKYPDWGTTREQLMRILYREAIESGATVRHGATVVDISDVAQVRPAVKLQDNTWFHADLIIIADGVKSRVRPKVLADLSTPQDPIVSNTTLYGFQLPAAELSRHPGTARLMDQTCINSWMGQDTYVITRYNPKLKEVGFHFGITSETDQKELWDEKADISYVRDFFKGSCSELATGLQLANSCDRWKLAEMPDLPRWTTHAGRIVLLGDSAHSMHPNAAQGYSQIVEDIGVLDYLISETPKDTPLSKITYHWQQIRKPRADRVKAFSKWNTQVFTAKGAALASRQHSSSEHGQTGTVRDMRLVKADMDAKFSSAAFLKWALDYDAIEEARIHMAGNKSRL